MFYKYTHTPFFLIVFFLTLSSSCKKNTQEDYSVLTKIPESFPAMKIPDDNHFTIERWALGKSLFYDTKLSIDSSISCSSCHKIEFAFSDNQAKTPGVFNRPGSRNAPTLTNIGFQPYFTKEGGVETLEQQVLIPIEEHNEMAFNILDAGIRLNKIKHYKEKSLEAYQREMDYYVITRALSCFERSFISASSAYDLENLSQSAQRGKDLFYSTRTNCSSCHGGILFTDFSFQNNGLYTFYEDKGRYRLSQDSLDIGLFKVPSLRNISFTAPYMHDGSLNTLEEVILHYNSGGKPHPNKCSVLTELNLNEQEIEDLLSFLESLSDYNFINNELLNHE